MDFNLTEEEDLIRSTVEELAQSSFKERADEIDKKSIFPTKNINDLAELGLLGSIISPELEGGGTSTMAYTVILEEIARACASTSVIVSVTTMVAKAIEREGTKSQKQKFVPRLATGETLGSFCLTESDAGSDPSSMKTTATKEGDEFIIDGQKLWITNAPFADIFLVMAKDPEIDDNAISAFIVQKSAISEGDLSISAPEKKMGLNGSHTCAVYFDEVHIPENQQLGVRGKGLSIALKSLDLGRIGISAQALGIGQAAFEASLQYAKERKQFGKPIGKFQGVSFKIADMKMQLEAARMLTYKTAWMADNGKNHTMESSMSKANATETACEITQQAIRVHGGMGFSKDLPLERYHRDIQATLLYEGTNEIQRVVIARELGL